MLAINWLCVVARPGCEPIVGDVVDSLHNCKDGSEMAAFWHGASDVGDTDEIRQKV
jgi:hypothetical protein